jgi:hypothetical protein
MRQIFSAKEAFSRNPNRGRVKFSSSIPDVRYRCCMEKAWVKFNSARILISRPLKSPLG